MSEAAELKRFGARPQPNSGRGKHNKGDGILDNKYIVDVKESGKTFGLSKKVWAKVCTDAAQSNMEPLLLVVLGEEGKVLHRKMGQVTAQDLQLWAGLR